MDVVFDVIKAFSLIAAYGKVANYSRCINVDVFCTYFVRDYESDNKLL